MLEIIHPKLLRVAGDAVIPSLVSLYQHSIDREAVFTSRYLQQSISYRGVVLWSANIEIL